jgi:hypothetical protein
MDSFGKTLSRGFVRFFVVREDVMRSDGEFFEGILKKINTYMYSESRQFLKKKRKFGRRIYVERAQKLNRISSYSWKSEIWAYPERKTIFPETGRILSFQEDV